MNAKMLGLGRTECATVGTCLLTALLLGSLASVILGGETPGGQQPAVGSGPVHAVPKKGSKARHYVVTESLIQHAQGRENRSFLQCRFDVHAANGTALKVRIHEYECWVRSGKKKMDLPVSGVAGRAYSCPMKPGGQEAFVLEAVTKDNRASRGLRKLLERDVLPLLLLRIPSERKRTKGYESWHSTDGRREWQMRSLVKVPGKSHIYKISTSQGGHKEVLKADSLTCWRYNTVHYDAVSRRVKTATAHESRFRGVSRGAACVDLQRRDVTVTEVGSIRAAEAGR